MLRLCSRSLSLLRPCSYCLFVRFQGTTHELHRATDLFSHPENLAETTGPHLGTRSTDEPCDTATYNYMRGKASSHPTLADVARLAGVGKATVSRVLNGAGRVSPETLKRVTDVIRDLGYQPSQAARSLKGDGTKAIGLLMPSIADPFFAGSAEAAQRVVSARGYLLVIALTNYDPQTELDHLQRLLRQRVEGILLAPGDTTNRKRNELINRLNIPVVAFNHPVRGSRVPSVVSDNRTSARLATEHLLSHGYRRVLCLGGDARLYTIQERQRGYLEAMDAAGLPPAVEGEANDYAAVNAVLLEACRKRSIEAIFAVRNRITMSAFQTLREAGIRIPQDVALLGFDDFEMSTVLRPAITVVEQPIELLASEAANLLLERLGKGTAGTSSKVMEMKTRLIIRQSCGCGSGK
jgi:LacI family transcriptional regulator